MCTFVRDIERDRSQALAAFTTAKAHDLSVLLQFRDELIALSNHIVVPKIINCQYCFERQEDRKIDSLLILVICALRLNDPSNSINRARKSV